jgi:hypothetical protein
VLAVREQTVSKKAGSALHSTRIPARFTPIPHFVLSHHIAAAADSRSDLTVSDLTVSDAKLICFDEAVLGICCRLCGCWLPNLTGSLNAGVHGSTSVRLSPMTPVGNDTPGAMVTEKRLPAQR